MATYKKFATKDGTPIQVQSAIEDGAGKNIQNDYAKQDGYYEGLTAGYADNLTPYSPDSGVYQAIPFNFQGTGCGNGETQVDTGSFCQFKEKRGNGIVYNQLARPFENTYWTAVNGTVSFDNGVATFVVSTPQTSNATRIYSKENYKITFTTNHKYIYICTAKYNSISGTTPTLSIATYSYDVSVSGIYEEVGTLTSFYKTFAVIKDHSTKPTANYESRIGLYCKNDPAVGDSYSVKDFYLIDLTKWFNGNIPQYLLDHPESFFRYYSGALTYNIGEVRFSNARYLTTIGRNQWDEEYTAGGWINDNGTIGTGYANRFCSKNFIRVAPNTEYYFRVPYSASDYGIRIGYYDSAYNVIKVETYYGTHKVVPENCIYIKFAVTAQYGSTTYNNDVTISIYYTGESGYTDYYPFEQLQEVDTGPEQLYQAGSAYDKKERSGLITRNIGNIDLGSLTWTYDGNNQAFYTTSLNNTIKKVSNSETVNVQNNLYVAYRWYDLAYGDMRVGYYNDGSAFRLYIKDTSYTDAATFKTAMSGVYLYYELATPTTEQGTPFTESVKIDDFGSMSLESANGVPQDNLIFYPVDYKAFVDTLVNYTDGDATSLAKKSDIVQELPDAPSTDGTFVLKATVSSGTVSYEWVEETP